MGVSYRMVSVFKSASDSYQSLGSVSFEQDIESCLALARQNPAYGNTLDCHLPDVWRQLLIEKRMFLAMIEEAKKGEDSAGRTIIQTRPIGFRFTCFVRGDYYRSVLRRARYETLEPRVCTELYEQHKRANRLQKSPILTRKEVAQANARSGDDGLYGFSFTFHEDQALETQSGLQGYAQAVVGAIEEMLRGYWVEGLVSEHYSAHAKVHLPRTGFEIIAEYAPYYRRNSQVAEKHRLFLAHVDRAILQKPENVGTMAYYTATLRRPELDLTLEQKELLEFMHEGATKGMLAQHYGTTEQAIRARIAVIYRKIRASDPTLLKDGTEWANLLAYLKDHYEEFRPYYV